MEPPASRASYKGTFPTPQSKKIGKSARNTENIRNFVLGEAAVRHTHANLNEKSHMRALLLFLTAAIAFTPLYSKENIMAYHLSTINGLPDNDIRYIDSDETGYIYLTSKYSTWQYDGYTFREMGDSLFAMYQKRSRTIVKDKEGWMLDNRGNRFRVVDGHIRYRDKADGREYSFRVYDSRIAALFNSLKVFVITDRRGRIWASVNGNGVFVFDKATGEVRHLCAKDGSGIIDYDMIVAIHEDANGDVWVSQEHYGIVKLKTDAQNVSTVFIDGQGGSSTFNNIRMMQAMPDGTFIVASNTGALLSADSMLETFTPLSMPDENYLSACKDREGRLWLGSRQHGVLAGGRWHSGGRIDCIYRDRTGRMWICGITGDLRVLDIGREASHEKTILKDIAPRFIYEDSRGVVWLAANSGLYIFRPEELLANGAAYRKIASIPIRTLYEDSRHRMWIGTERSGLYYCSVGERDFRKFRNISTGDGLPNSIVQGIIETPSGHICVTTENGCAFIDPSGRNVTRTLYLNSHIRRNFYNERCIACLPDGRIALGSLDGIVIVDDIALQAQTGGAAATLPLRVTGMNINGTQAYDMGSECPFAGDISGVREMTLRHSQNSLTIFFSNFAYDDERQTDYSYRLVGAQEEWSAPSQYNFATFRDLAPGRYAFEVRYRSRGGDWVPSPNLMSITIEPPIWGTWWAMLLYGLIVAGASTAIYRNGRTLYRLRRDVAVERQLTEYKLRFFTNISHEFRTPLTIIHGSMERIMAAGEIPGALKTPISNMQKSVGRMSRLINQLLEFRKMQNGRLTLALQETEAVGFIREIWETFRDVAEEKGIAGTFMPQRKTLTAFIDRGHIDKIVHNLLSNAFKYTKNGGSVQLGIRAEGDWMRIIVADTGIGITEEKKRELFARFVTGRVSADSVGIGLNLTWELVRTHHGTIAHEDNEGGGSVFTVSLPLDPKAYSEDEFMKETPGIVSDSKAPQDARGQYMEMAGPPLNAIDVLLAEDDADISQMMRGELGRYFNVTIAHDGAEAWELLDGERGFRLVITDAMMPGVDGFELVRRIRRGAKHKGIPIIMLTALESHEDMARGLGLGVDAYISKPFSIEVLVAQCVSLLKRQADMQAEDAKEARTPPKPQAIITDAKDRQFIRQLDAAIERNMGDAGFDVEEMCAIFGMGRTAFYKYVKDLTGNSPAAYLRSVRLQRAYGMLSSQDNAMNVQQVAASVGFANSQHFATAFKKAYGLSPKQVRMSVVKLTPDDK